MKILEVDKLKKIYHTPKEEILALNDISFYLNEKEIVSIIGPSGCGKSTILSCLTGLLDKSNGEIINKNNLKFGYMLQNDALFPWLNILDNCLLGLKIQNKLTVENKEYVINLLQKYGLKDFIYSYPQNLSGGMRQRVALIRTLATKPDILLLDEPFSALDYQSRLSVSDDVFNIIHNEGKSAIIVTHDIAEALSMSDRIIVLSKRPSTIKSIYEVKMTDMSTPINNRKCKEFSTYYDIIWKEIDKDE